MAIIKARTQIEAEAATIFDKEKTAWETATAFVTDRVSFNIRNLIRLLRKNYWGVFDEPIDPSTGHKKIWPPLTESMVESSIKSIDLDTKDFNTRAKKSKSIGLTKIVRAALKNELDAMNFGEVLDDLERRLAIDGTVVVKITEEKDKKGKKRAVIRPVDLLNWYIDPTAQSLHDSPVIERAIYSEADLNDIDLPLNKELLTGKKDIQRFDGELNNGIAYNSTSGEVKYYELYERWGRIPENLITGEEKDREKEVEGHMIASYNNGWIIHLIEKNTKGTKPYEEGWWTRVPGRWYGRGVAEKAMMLQLWLNMVINMRINRSRVSQLGIFKYKKGAGITPQQLSRLASNGAVPVTNMEDLQQFVMQEIGASSYKDEETIMSWAQRVTSAFEVVTGEKLPASTSATAVAVQSQAAASSFTLIREGFGKFLERVVEGHVLQIISKNIKKGDIIRLTGDPDDLREYDERVVNELLYKSLEEVKKHNDSQAEKIFIDPAQIELERQRLTAQLRNMGSERYTKLMEDIDWTEYDVKVFVTNEEFDKAVMVQNLVAALQYAPEFKEQIIQATFDLMGLDFKPSQMPPQMAGAQQVGGAPQGQNMQQIMTQANTRQAIG